MRLLAALVLALTLSASAADLSGTWSGSMKVTGPDGQVQDDTIHLVLKQDGAKLTWRIETESLDRRVRLHADPGRDGEATEECRRRGVGMAFDGAGDADHRLAGVASRVIACVGRDEEFFVADD